MNTFMTGFASLFLIYATAISSVYGIDTHEKAFSKDELIALTRDHLGRIDPDELLGGFFPVWAMIQFLIACFFLFIAIISFVCYLFGCRTPPDQPKKEIK